MKKILLFFLSCIMVICCAVSFISCKTTEETYTVSFYAYEHEDPIATIQCKPGEQIVIPQEVLEYVPESGDKLIWESQIMPDYDISIIAKAKKLCTLEVFVDGELYNTLTGYEGDAVELDDPPEKFGYRFEWYTSIPSVFERIRDEVRGGYIYSVDDSGIEKTILEMAEAYTYQDLSSLAAYVYDDYALRELFLANADPETFFQGYKSLEITSINVLSNDGEDAVCEVSAILRYDVNLNGTSTMQKTNLTGTLNLRRHQYNNGWIFTEVPNISVFSNEISTRENDGSRLYIDEDIYTTVPVLVKDDDYTETYKITVLTEKSSLNISDYFKCRKEGWRVATFCNTGVLGWTESSQVNSFNMDAMWKLVIYDDYGDLYFEWELDFVKKGKIDITFYTYDRAETVEKQTILQYQKAKCIVGPEIAGYEFVGWVDSNGEFFDFSTRLSAGESLYAAYISANTRDLIQRIDEIGEVTLESKALLNELQAEYEKLTESEQAFIYNIKKLDNAVAELFELEWEIGFISYGTDIGNPIIKAYHGSDTKIVVPTHWGIMKIVAIDAYVFYDSSIEEIYFPASIKTIYQQNIKSNTIVYCEPASRPNGWDPKFSGSATTVIWGASNVVVSDGIVYNINEDGTATILSIIDASDSVIIPEEYNGHKVVGLSDDALQTLSKVANIDMTYRLYAEIKANLPSWTVSSLTLRGIDTWTSGDFDIFYESQTLNELYLYGQNAGECIGELSLLKNLTKVSIEGYYTDKNGILYSSDKTQIIFVPMGAEGRIELENTLLSIGADSFAGRSKIESLVIPASVSQIDLSAFVECSALLEISVVAENNSYATSDGILYNKTFTEILYVPVNIQGKVTIVEGVTQIGSDLFKDRKGITEIVLPDSLTSLAYNAFSGCESIIETENGIHYVDRWVIDCDISVTGVSIRQDTIGIGNLAFYNCRSLTSITIPDSVTGIGMNAFEDCNKLTSITLPFVGATKVGATKTYFGYIFGADWYSQNSAYVPKSLKTVILTGSTSIYNYSFYGCNSLESIIIPDSVTSIGKDAFSGCSALTSIIIPDSVTSIGESAFYGCSALTSIAIPDSVTSIDKFAFSGCNNVIQIEDGIRYVDKWVVGYGTSLSAPDLRNNTVGIANYALYDCSSLTSITIPDSVTTIGEYAFYGCSALTSIVIPDSVTSIGDYTFYGCSALTSIVIPDSVTSIGDYTFYGCSALASVVISDSVISIGDYAFNYCSDLTNVSIGNCVTIIGEYAFSYCSALTSIVIPDSVTSIGYSAFSGCRSLTSMVIPDSVTSIGKSVFSGCSSLTSITLPFIGAETHFGFIFGAGRYSQNSIYVPKSLKTVILTGSTSIANYAFYDCISLVSITIPDSVTSIGESAFSGCSSLTNVSIGSGVTSIGESAFYGCNSLTSITLPFIGAIKDGTKNMHFGYIFGADSYSYNNNYVPKSLKTVILTGSASVADYAFYGCSSLTSVTIPDSVKSISDSAFYECSALTSVSIGNGLINIGESAFYGCSTLTNIAIPDSVTSIGRFAFSRCNALTNIVIPESVTSISGSAFYECSALTSVVISDSVTSISDYTFYGCGALTSIIIPDSVTSIGDFAFSNCSALTSIVIPDSVTTIGTAAFYGCNKLTNVIFENTNGWWYADSSTATSGTKISESDLANHFTAATYLTSTYVWHYWKRG